MTSPSSSPTRRCFDFLALLAVGLAVVYLNVIIPNSAKKERLRAPRNDLKANVEGVRAEVDRLAQEINALRTDPYYIERRLRSEIHYLRPGERVFESKSALPKPSRKKNQG